MSAKRRGGGDNTMMQADLVIANASELLTCAADKPKRGKALSDLGIIRNGAVAVKNGLIAWVGKTSEFDFEASQVLDAGNRLVMPGFVDCHTHLVFGGGREKDLVRKLQGKSYLEILAEGGGILSTVEHTRAASEEELYHLGWRRLDTMLAHGTTTVEIKSGYGLDEMTEQKILRVARRLGRDHPMDVATTYLGAHAIPGGRNREEYVAEVLASLEKMRSWAEFCDVFCEKGAFTLEESRHILEAAKSLGYKLKIHAEQMTGLGGAALAAALGAVSADHLDHISERGIQRLARSNTIGVLLPGASFYLMQESRAPARGMIEGGAALALATDFNPGSCPCENMQLMLTLACLQMKLLPAEAINCATINAAFALDRAGAVGSLEEGKQADILIADVVSHESLVSRFGTNRVARVIKKGMLMQTGKTAEAGGGGGQRFPV